MRINHADTPAPQFVRPPIPGRQAVELSDRLIVTLPPGCVPIFDHVHDDIDHFVYMLDGALDIWLDGRQVHLTRGQSCFVRRGVKHRVANSETLPARLLLVSSPGREAQRLFAEIQQVIIAPETETAWIAEVLARHGSRLAEPA